jgi:NADPH:quinone reductase-like Zn-dependent oxidoreductase
MTFCRELGADLVIDFASEDVVSIVRERFGGADVILDIIGGPYIQKNIKTCRHDGRIVQLAFSKGFKVEVNLMPIMLKRLVLTGATLRSRPPAFKAAVARGLEERAWPMFGDGRLRTVTHKVYDFDDAAAAHAAMETGGHAGKILLKL